MQNIRTKFLNKHISGKSLSLSTRLRQLSYHPQVKKKQKKQRIITEQLLLILGSKIDIQIFKLFVWFIF